MKKIIIAGGTGFLGDALHHFFQKKGDEVKVLARKPNAPHHIKWDGKNLGDWTQALEGADLLINLCGKSVDCRYTPSNRKAILDSRIITTNLLQTAINSLSMPPKLWMNSSSASTYIHSETQLNTEETGIIGDDFSMNICKQWEKAFFQDSQLPIRKIALRTSIVLGNTGGAFPKLKQIAKLGLGGKQGGGQQKVSWIHIDDFCKAVDFLNSYEEISGAVNITSPQPVSNEVFMEQLRKMLKMPVGFNQSKLMLEIGAWLMGTETELLLKSRNVFPQRLLDANFQFQYADLASCLEGLRGG